jgi:hypothetical protein
VNEIKALEADTKAQEEADKTGFQSKVRVRGLGLGSSPSPRP